MDADEKDFVEEFSITVHGMSAFTTVLGFKMSQSLFISFSCFKMLFRAMEKFISSQCPRVTSINFYPTLVSSEKSFEYKPDPMGYGWSGDIGKASKHPLQYYEVRASIFNHDEKKMKINKIQKDRRTIKGKKRAQEICLWAHFAMMSTCGDACGSRKRLHK